MRSARATNAASPPPTPGPAGRRVGRFESFLATRPLAVAAVLTLLVDALAAVCFTPHYETNDDTAMNLIAAGQVFVDRPDEHLMFTNVLIGLPLRYLYAAAPAVPWYGLYQWAVISLGCVAGVYALLRIRPSLRQVSAVCLFVAAVVLPCLVDVQFTKTAFLVSGAGLLLVLAPLCEASPWPRRADAAAVVLMVLGALIRAECLLLAGVMAVPAALFAARGRGARAAWRAIPVGVAGLLAAAAVAFNGAYYARDPQWRDFYAYNALRAEFTDYGRFQSGANDPVFQDIGWRPIDLRMIRLWFFADRDRYSLGNLRRVVAEATPDPPAPLGKVAATVVRQAGANGDLLRLCVTSLGLALLAGNRRGAAVTAAQFALALLLAVTLATWYWITPRVAFSLLIGVFTGVATTTGAAPDAPADARRDGGGVFPLLAGVIAGGLLFWGLAATAIADGQRQRLRAEAVEALRRLAPRSDQLYVVWADRFPFERFVAPFSSLTSLRDLRCVALSWLTPTPFTRERLAAFEVTDVYRALQERPDVYLVAAPSLVIAFEEYELVHYQMKVVCQPTFDSPSFTVYQVRPSAPPARSKSE